MERITNFRLHCMRLKEEREYYIDKLKMINPSIDISKEMETLSRKAIISGIEFNRLLKGMVYTKLETS